MLYGLKGEKDEPTQFNSSPSVLDKALLGVCFASFSWKIFLLRTYQAMYPAPGNHITDTLEENLQVLGLASSFKELSKNATTLSVIKASLSLLSKSAIFNA